MLSKVSESGQEIDETDHAEMAKILDQLKKSDQLKRRGK
jgi:hypothetical protein